MTEYLFLSTLLLLIAAITPARIGAAYLMVFSGLTLCHHML